MNSDKLFSYGTLRYEHVQIANFGRKLHGKEDVLTGFILTTIEIKDPSVVATSKEAIHPIISYTGNKNDRVQGMVFDVSSEEIGLADLYEVSDYKRIKVQLDSGVSAWVYANA